MLLKLLGWFWVISGIMCLLKPERLRNYFKRKNNAELRRLFFFTALILGFLLIKASWGMSGLLAKLLVAAGFMGIIKAIFFLKAQVATKLIDWFVAWPVKFYRLWAAGQIVFGAVLLSA